MAVQWHVCGDKSFHWSDEVVVHVDWAIPIELVFGCFLEHSLDLNLINFVVLKCFWDVLYLVRML